MRKAALLCISIFILSLGIVIGAQDMEPCKLPVNLERLADKADEVVDINLYGEMFRFAGNFLSAEDQDEAQVKELISNLNGICVRSFEFSESGQYTKEDIEELRLQFKSPDWIRIVGVRSKKNKDDADIYFRTNNEKITGLAVIAVEPMEFTFVYIDGSMDPKLLSKLSGNFGIPKVELPEGAKLPAAEKAE